MRSLTLFLTIAMVTTACGSMSPPPDEATDGGYPAADGAPPDGDPTGTPPDGAPTAPTCETITWDATTADPPHALLLPDVDVFSRFIPVSGNPSGGIGIGDDGEVSAGETLAVQFTRHVELLSYSVRGGSHHTQLRLTTGEVVAEARDDDGVVQVSENITELKLSGATTTGETVLESMTYAVCSDDPVVIPPPRCRKHAQSFQNDFVLLDDLALADGVLPDEFRRGVGPGADGRLTSGEVMELRWSVPRFVHGYTWIERESDGVVGNSTHDYLVTLSDGSTVSGSADASSGLVPIQLPGVVSVAMAGRSTDRIVVSGVSYITCDD